MKRKSIKKGPPQITLGGKVGQQVWRKFVVPIIRDGKKSSRMIAKELGISHNTVAIWRREYA